MDLKKLTPSLPPIPAVGQTEPPADAGGLRQTGSPPGRPAACAVMLQSTGYVAYGTAPPLFTGGDYSTDFGLDQTPKPRTPTPVEPRPDMSTMTYKSAGVDYDVLDNFKRACQKAAVGTVGLLHQHGFSEPAAIRGESAYVMEAPDAFYAHVEEALGTKILIADAMYQLTGRSFYQNVAIDDVATIANDLCAGGALPVTVAMYAAVGDNSYFADTRLPTGRCRLEWRRNPGA